MTDICGFPISASDNCREKDAVPYSRPRRLGGDRRISDVFQSAPRPDTGSFVELCTKSAPEVWVLNPKMLRAYIEREPVGLKTEDVALVASRIIKDLQKV